MNTGLNFRSKFQNLSGAWPFRCSGGVLAGPARMSMLSSSIYSVLQYRKHSTLQRSQPAQSRKASTYVPIRIRQCKQAARVCESQHRSSSVSLYSTLSSQKRRNRNLPGLQKYTTTHSAGVVREGFTFSFDLSKLQHCSFSPPFFVCIWCVRAASGL